MFDPTTFSSGLSSGLSSVLVDGAPELKDGPAVRAELRADLEKLQRAVASANAFATDR